MTGVSGALSDSLNAVAERLRVGVDFSMPPDRNWGALDDQVRGKLTMNFKVDLHLIDVF